MSYIVGHPIKKPADFYGRSEQTRRFFEIIGGTQAQSVSVLGLRRAGKTSFLQYVAHKDVMARYLPDPENYAMVYVDMSSCK
ncbi:MAG: ATP-binding protein, partial [Chloroflexi bacterium]|nr:ATP-binding protein [Chloroflexota bacterium]